MFLLAVVSLCPEIDVVPFSEKGKQLDESEQLEFNDGSDWWQRIQGIVCNIIRKQKLRGSSLQTV